MKFCLKNRSKILDEQTEAKISEIPDTQEAFSKADELKKLKELFDSGVLTEEEFLGLKTKLI